MAQILTLKLVLAGKKSKRVDIRPFLATDVGSSDFFSGPKASIFEAPA